MEAMPGVISAAEASGAEMATTATVMASAINSFGLKASDANHVADLLARSANDSAADIQYMGDALKYAVLLQKHQEFQQRTLPQQLKFYLTQVQRVLKQVLP